jgi:hypothetical protein
MLAKLYAAAGKEEIELDFDKGDEAAVSSICQRKRITCFLSRADATQNKPMIRLWTWI